MRFPQRVSGLSSELQTSPEHVFEDGFPSFGRSCPVAAQIPQKPNQAGHDQSLVFRVLAAREKKNTLAVATDYEVSFVATVLIKSSGLSLRYVHRGE